MRLSGHDIICLSGTDWDHPVESRCHAVMALLAEMNRVLVVNPPGSRREAVSRCWEPRWRARWGVWLRRAEALRQIAQNLQVWTPPFGVWRSPWAAYRVGLKAIATDLGFHHPILWCDTAAPVRLPPGELGELLIVAHGPVRGEPLGTCDVAFLPERGARRGEAGVHFAPDGVDMASWQARCREMEGLILDALALSLIHI